MLKLTKKADYGLIAMRHLAEHADLGACSAKDLAEMYSIPQEALAKILQRLTKAGLLVSQYGTNGGYTLARDPRRISAFEVIRAIDGPLFITSCSAAQRLRPERPLHGPRTAAQGEPQHRRSFEPIDDLGNDRTRTRRSAGAGNSRLDVEQGTSNFRRWQKQ